MKLLNIIIDSLSISLVGIALVLFAQNNVADSIFAVVLAIWVRGGNKIV